MKKRSRLTFLPALWIVLLLSACALPWPGDQRSPLPLPTDSTGPTEPGKLAPHGTPGGLVFLPQVSSRVNAPSVAVSTPTGLPAARGAAASTLREITFSVSEPQPVPPGILPQVSLFEMGGGGGDAGTSCANTAGQARWCQALQGTGLISTQDYRVTACGLDGQPATASVSLPDGRTAAASVNGGPNDCREVVFVPGPGAPLGAYQVTLSQGNTRLSDRFTLAAPPQPSGRLDHECAWLAGLNAGQSVRLLIFGLALPTPDDPGLKAGLATWKFLAAQNLTAGPDRSLLACPDPSTLDRFPELAFLAYPEGSEKPVMVGNSDVLNQFQGNCAGGPATRLVAGEYARVMTQALPLFGDPAMETKPVTQAAPGSKVTLLYGPVCPLQGPWTWQVRTQDQKIGWAAESDTAAYFLEPVP